MPLGSATATIIGYLGKATNQGREIHGRQGTVLKDVVHFTGGGNDQQQGNDVECVELLCIGHPDNTGRVWVRTGDAATVNNAWPLAAGEIFSCNVTNLSELQMLIAVSGEKLIVAHT